MATNEDRIYDALIALLCRSVDDSFVRVEDPQWGKFVQVGKGGLRIDVPFVALTNDEAGRAYRFFERLGDACPREYDAPDFSTGAVRHGATFIYDFGDDARAAATRVASFFWQVYLVPRDVQLSIGEY